MGLGAGGGGGGAGAGGGGDKALNTIGTPWSKAGQSLGARSSRGAPGPIKNEY